jgi:iron complex transport system ATP-binding protein
MKPVELAFQAVRLQRGTFAFAADAIRLRPGAITVLLGPNGGGKTTALRLAAGLLAPDVGHVLVDGSPIASLRPAVRAHRVAYVPQRPDVGLPFLAREVVELGRHALQRSPDRIQQAMEAVGMAAHGDRPFHELSAGQQQRIAVARALAQHAPGGLLLLDEAFSAVDPAESAGMLAALRAVADAGATVMLATHDLAVAAAAADEAWMIRGGRTEGFGPADALLAPERLGSFLGLTVALAEGSRGRAIPVPDLRAGRPTPRPET